MKCLDCRSLGARFSDRFPCRLRGDSGENFPPRLQTLLGRERAVQPMSAKLQHDFGMATVQKNTTRAANTKLDASNRAEEERKRSNFPQTWAAVAAASKPQRVQPKREPPKSMGHPSPARQRV